MVLSSVASAAAEVHDKQEHPFEFESVLECQTSVTSLVMMNALPAE